MPCHPVVRRLLAIACLCALAQPAAAQNNLVALVQSGADALEEGRWADALDAFTQAARLSPRDASICFGAGAAASMLGQQRDAREWLERALALQPRYTDASLVLGQILYQAGDQAGAIHVYETALAHAPSNPVLKERLDEWRRESQVNSRFYQAQGAHFSVLFEGPADEALARRAVDILEAVYWRIGSQLTAYPAAPITVVLYTREQFRDVTRSPEWSGGVYDGRIKVPMRGALDKPTDLERVLAHEYVHALVTSIGGRAVPAWLNEGLATVLEPGGREWTEAYLAQEIARIPQRELQRGFGRLSDDDATLAYAQSAAAVQKMIELRGASAVVTLLQALGRGVPFASAFQQAIAMRYEDFTTMIGQH